VCATDDRYADDIHYMGGCLLGDHLSWSSTMMAYTSLPPDPEMVGEKWLDMWLERMDSLKPWLLQWMEHQKRDDYWKHGSVCEDYSQIQCPVLAVSGWADGYSNAVFRLLEHLEVPCEGLIGPWGHNYPHQGYPGPSMGFLQYALQWWKRFLEPDRHTGETKSGLRVWMQRSVPPTHNRKEHPGHWVWESRWPSPNVKEKVFSLSRWSLHDTVEESPGGEEEASIQSPLSVGLFAGRWCSFSATPDLPVDQREEDGGSLVFESQPLQEELELLGAPIVELTLRCDRPQAMVAARLSDVLENGQATRITYGLLNLAHRNSHEFPEPLPVGETVTVRFHLNALAHRFSKGHRMRLSLSTSYWPLAWPSPEPTTLTVRLAESRLILPYRVDTVKDDNFNAYRTPEGALPLETETLEPPDHRWTVTRDLASDYSQLRVLKDTGTVRQIQSGTTLKTRTDERYGYRAFDFESLSGEVETLRVLRRGDWEVTVTTRSHLTCDKSNFYLQADMDAWEKKNRLFCRSWSETIPRDHM
jgi:predicted acyl esterase